MTPTERIARLDESLARDTGVSVPALRAIRQVESGGNPRAVRFETRVFRNRTGQTVEGSNRAAFERAFAINPLEAVNSTSWGWFQVMGFHGFPEMYGGPAQAVRAFDADPEGVSIALFKRWMSKPAARTAKAAAARLDFATFASVYNGCAMPCERYSTRMRAAYERVLPEWEEYLRTRPVGGSIALFAVLAGVAGGIGFYFYKRKKKTGSFFGVEDDVEETYWTAQDEYHDSFWVGGPDRRSKGGEDGPRDSRRGKSVIDTDRSGNRVVSILDDFDCGELNRSINRLIHAKDGWGRLLAKYPNPEVFDNVKMPPEPYEPDEYFGPDVIENSEHLLDERIDVLRSIARANGCSQIAGLRR